MPSAILRRLGTYSRKNRLYFAFRELGRAIRTAFLLGYIGSVDLRRTISAATNKEQALQPLCAMGGVRGGGGLVTAAARDEQRKMIKYNHLVANLPIFHTAIGMTRALDGIAADGFGDAASPEGIATLSPYQTEHINRFGDYVLGYVDAARAAAVHAAAAPTDEASDN